MKCQKMQIPESKKYAGASWTVSKRKAVRFLRHFLRTEMSSDFYSHLGVKVCESHLQANNCHERRIKEKLHSNMLVCLLPSPSGLTVKDEKRDPTRTRRTGRYRQRMGGVRTIAEGRKHDRGTIRATIQQPKCRRYRQGSGSQEQRQSHTERPREGEASGNEG